MRLNLNLTSQGINFKDKRKSLNSAEKRTLVNALDTIDLEVENGKKRADKLNSRNECLPVFLTLPFFLVSFNKLSPSKFLALLLGMIGVGAVSFGLTNKKYAQIILENEILAQKKSGMFETENSSKNDLSNPNLFLPITDTKQKQIDEMEIVKEIKSKKYSDKFLDIFISPFSKENHEYSQELNDIKKEYRTEKPVLTDVSEAVKQIDDGAKDYSKKALIGINSILALASAAGIGLTTLLQKSNEILLKSIKNVYIKSFATILPLAPMFGLMLVADSNIVKDVDKISRYKAKEDFLKNSNMQNDKLSFAKKSIFETTIDYFKTRKEYKQKIEQQKDLLLIKNNILANSKSSKEEINEAKEFKTKFYNAINSEQRIENKYQENLKNTFSNRYLLYLLATPLCTMLTNGIILNKNKMIYTAGGILSGTFVTQALLNYYTKDK